MGKMKITELIQFAKKKFELQTRVLSLWQSLADNFYPERADFLQTRNIGDEMTDHLLSTYPVMMRRDLGNALDSMLRDGDWFKIAINGEPDHSGKMWLQWATGRQKKIMYHRDAGFIRSTKQGDHDYATFGNLVISVEPNRHFNGLLFRNWHLRDCAWWDDETGQVCGLARKWRPSLWELVEKFGLDNLHPNLQRKYPKDQLSEVDCMHVQIPMHQYGDDSEMSYALVYIDVKNEHILEEVYVNRKHYAVPRFQTIAGSPYAISPAAITALPDARMIQAMTHTLMEAGERYARPPLIAVGGKKISSAIDLSADGITYIDPEYDQRSGPALAPLNQDRGGFPIGLELRDSIVDVLASAWYINKLSLPEVTRDMTAYEVQERMKQYRRENLPLFAPAEADYNGQICEMSFDLAMEMNMFGSVQDIPESLQDQDVVFKFESPLTESEEEKKGQRFRQISEMAAEAAQIDPSVSHNINFDEALRDAIEGIGCPEKWLNPVELVSERRQAEAEAMMVQDQNAAA